MCRSRSWFPRKFLSTPLDSEVHGKRSWKRKGKKLTVRKSSNSKAVNDPKVRMLDINLYMFTVFHGHNSDL